MSVTQVPVEETTNLPLSPRPEPPVNANEPVAAPSLAELVHHAHHVQSHTTLAEVHGLFRILPHDFLAIVRDGKVEGLCSRAAVGFLLGARYGFALYSTQPVTQARAPRPLVFNRDVPVTEVLRLALSRQGSEFFEDVVLVDDNGGLVGLIPVPSLARVQLQLFGEQIKRTEAQDDELRRQNLDLFQMNQELRQSHGRYKVLFENNALGVALLDPHGAVLAHNSRFAELLRLPGPSAPPGCRLQQLVAPADTDRLVQLLAKLERDAPHTETHVTELVFAVGGSQRDFVVHSSWIAETGQVSVCLADITEQRAFERRVVRQEKQAMLDTLVAGVAHELNNKLTPVVGFADLLEMVAGSQHTMEVRGIRQCALEASQIIKQLLQLSRPADRDHGPVDLRAIVTDTIEILRYQIRTGRCELTVDLPKAEALVLGAPAQLKQVLVNLVLNAVHAMETSANRRLGVGVRVYPGEVELFVADSGCGIPSENLHRIFDPFFTTKSPDRGTGLGLSISQSLVRQHEGEIRVQSDVGRGTTFKVVLPRVQHQAPATEAPAPPARTSDGAVPADPSRRLQVLVVDDENFVRQFLQEAIRTSFPCSVDAACDGLDAVARLERTDYDLVVSDIRMPRMDGLQLRDWICRNRPSLAARLVFVTGHAGAIELTTDLAALAMPVLRKPFTVEAIRDTCRPLLLGAN